MYFGSSDVVYAIKLDEGELKWQFETAEILGATTYCEMSSSTTVVTRRVTANVDANLP